MGAIEQFLKHMPDNTGMALVIVQHLDPTRKGMLVKLLQRATSMPVIQAKQRTAVRANHVYVIPPNRDMALQDGLLHLTAPSKPRGLRLPIDLFLYSLAMERGKQSIGVILSGMGSDGTLGLRTIKEQQGGTFVQDPASAKFSGMPSSATSAGLADVVAPAEELPNRILTFRQNPTLRSAVEYPRDVDDRSSLDKIIVLMRSQTGHDFSMYKKSTLYRRIERRMSLHQIANIADYTRYLHDNSQEIPVLFNEFLIGVTSFFRDAPAWEQLRQQMLPARFVEHPEDRELRAWVAGCSTGEEAYSLAIVFREAAAQVSPAGSLQLQIFATDIDSRAVDVARQGYYSTHQVANVSAERLKRFFVPYEGGYRISQEIREMVIFAPQTVIMDPPFAKLDILSCRNLLIYFSAELQRALIPLFHYSLKLGGLLLLGSSETVGSFNNLFSSVDDKSCFYRRIDTSLGPEMLDFPASFSPARPGSARTVAPMSRTILSAADLPLHANRILLAQHCPTAVLVSDRGSIIYINGRSGKYLEPAAGTANWNIFAMARAGLRHELDFAFAKAQREKRTVVRSGLKAGNDDETQTVDVVVQPLTEPEIMCGLVLVVFRDVQAPPKRKSAARKLGVTLSALDVGELQQELALAREEIGNMRQAQQNSQEEYRSANEELESANEELQSANEEMTTSREEMQSLNEELHTVNRELQIRLNDLAQSNSDMSNLLNSTDIATLFLDSKLCIHRFTPRAAKIIKLLPTDLGRPVTDLASDLEYPQMTEDAVAVLRTLIPIDKPVTARSGLWIAVRMMPYRTVENRIDGLVITFTDITTIKLLEADLQSRESQLKQVTRALPLLLWTCRADGTCSELSPQWERFTGIFDPRQLMDGWLQQVHQEDHEQTLQVWEGARRQQRPFTAELRLRDLRAAYHRFTVTGTPIRDAGGRLLHWSFHARDHAWWSQPKAVDTAARPSEE